MLVHFASYLWSTGETTRTINIHDAGNYSATVTDSNGCEGNDQITITETTPPQPDIAGVTEICHGASTTLEAGSFDSYLWSTGETTQTIKS